MSRLSSGEFWLHQDYYVQPLAVVLTEEIQPSRQGILFCRGAIEAFVVKTSPIDGDAIVILRIALLWELVRKASRTLCWEVLWSPQAQRWWIWSVTLGIGSDIFYTDVDMYTYVMMCSHGDKIVKDCIRMCHIYYNLCNSLYTYFYFNWLKNNCQGSKSPSTFPMPLKVFVSSKDCNQLNLCTSGHPSCVTDLSQTTSCANLGFKQQAQLASHHLIHTAGLWKLFGRKRVDLFGLWSEWIVEKTCAQWILRSLRV